MFNLNDIYIYIVLVAFAFILSRNNSNVNFWLWLHCRVAHFGELAPECATSYYKYGCALLYKAQDEADPLNASVALEKKAQASMKNVSNGTSEKDGEEESSEVPASEEKTRVGESSEVPVSEACAPPDTDAKGKTISHDNGKESTEKDNDEGF